MDCTSIELVQFSYIVEEYSSTLVRVRCTLLRKPSKLTKNYNTCTPSRGWNFILYSISKEHVENNLVVSSRAEV